MEDIFDPSCAEQIRARIQALTAAHSRQWGKMSAPQMMEHCARSLEAATGEARPPRVLMGYVLGRVLRPMMLKDGEPMRKNAPTAPSLVVAEDADLEASRSRLLAVFDRFVAGGEAGCSRHPHPFFGKLEPAEWSKLTHKHLDHHLRQFDA